MFQTMDPTFAVLATSGMVTLVCYLATLPTLPARMDGSGTDKLALPKAEATPIAPTATIGMLPFPAVSTRPHRQLASQATSGMVRAASPTSPAITTTLFSTAFQAIFTISTALAVFFKVLQLHHAARATSGTVMPARALEVKLFRPVLPDILGTSPSVDAFKPQAQATLAQLATFSLV